MSDEARIEKDKVWKQLGKSLGKELIPIKGRHSGRTTFDKKVAIHIAFSKFHEKGKNYWYGVREEDFRLWEAYERSFICFVLGQSAEIVIIPSSEFSNALKHSYISPTSGGITRLHIIRGEDNFHFIEMSDIKINAYYNNYAQLTIASASDFEDTEHVTTTQQPKGEIELRTPRIFGGRGESDAHKSFKEFVANNPNLFMSNADGVSVETEFILPSLDLIDVVFTNKSERIGVEVKSRISSIDDITRGLFQCVKYLALLKALHKTTNRELTTRVFLALEGPFPVELENIKELLEIDVIDNITIL